MELSLEKRIKQLENSSGLLSDALKKISIGDKKYFIVLGSQIRALICKGASRNSHPLLLEIAQEMKYKIKCYGPKNTNPNNELNKGLVFRFNKQIIGTEPYSPAQHEYTLEKWLTAYMLVLDEKFYTPNEILKTFGDKEASHFDPNTSLKLNKVKSLKHYLKNGETKNEVESILIQTSKFLIKTSDSIIKKYRNR